MGSTYLFKIVVTHSLLAARCCGGHGGLALFTTSGGALSLLLDRLGLRSRGTLLGKHFVPQVVGQLAVLGTEFAEAILRNPIVPATIISFVNKRTSFPRGINNCVVRVVERRRVRRGIEVRVGQA